MSWNRPNTVPPPLSAAGAGKKSIIRGIVAGAFVVIVAVAVWLILAPSKPSKLSKPTKPSSLIKEVMPAAAPTNKVVETPKKVYKTKEEQYFDETNGLSKMGMMRWRFQHRPPAGWTNDTSITEGKPSYAIFTYEAENDIAALLTHEPGQALIGDGGYGEKFRREFMKSCEVPILISDEDTPEQAALKKQMIATKIELRDRMAAGEDICEIMRETRKEYQRMNEMQDSVKSLLRDVKLEGGKTMQDMEDALAAANKMLEDKGVAPLKLSPLAKRMLMRHCTDYDPNKLKTEN